MSYISNPILNTDSYKASHFLQYPPDTTALFAYIESRGGVYPKTLFFGLQAFLKAYLARPVTASDINEAEAFWAAHGEPFNRAGWERIVTQFGGFLPLRIRAVPEGTQVPVSNVMVTVESTDPETSWIVNYIETALLRAIWYPTTVATISAAIKSSIKDFLDRTSDDPEAGLLLKLHDFGARGVTSAESAELGGLAHLVNFAGSDNVAAVVAAQRYYGEPMAAVSIPAAEHSTVTSWGREQEADAYRNILDKFAKPGKMVAVVSDSYDLHNALTNIWGGLLRQRVVDSGATVVIRPDSGDPVAVVLETAHALAQAFGTEINAKGFRVLQHVRILQGDGVNAGTINTILERLVQQGFSADNIAFGMGGALLQQLDRDTQRFAMKTSAAKVNGVWREIYKQPATDPGKQSKRGRLSLYRHIGTGKFSTMSDKDRTQGATADDWEDVLEPVWESGLLLRDVTLREIRACAAGDKA